MSVLDALLVGLVIASCLLFLARASRGRGCHGRSCGACPGVSACLRGKVKK